MLASDHNIDQCYGYEHSISSTQELGDVVRDIDISPLLCIPQWCLPCCRFYSYESSRGDDNDRSVGSDGEFSDLTQRLLTSQRDGAAASAASHEAQRERVGRRPILVNKNIFLYYLLTFIQGTADSLWRGTILSIFVVQLTADSNGQSEYFRFVGYLEGTFGLGQIFAMLLYPDEAVGGGQGRQSVKSSRRQREMVRDEATHTPMPGRQNSFTLKCAGIILLVTAIFNTIIVATLPNHQQDYRLFYQLLMLVLLFYGYSSSLLLSSSATRALLRSSSTKSGNVEWAKAERPIALAAGMFGPLVSIIIFAVVGNAYTIRNLQLVWYVGCALEMIVGLLSLGFSERYQIIATQGWDDEDVSESSLVEGQSDEDLDIGPGLVDIEDEEIEIDESMRLLQQKIDKVLVSDHDEPQSEDAKGDAQRSVRFEPSLMESSQSFNSSRALSPGSASPRSSGRDEYSHSSAGDNTNHIPRLLTLLPHVLLVASVLLFVTGAALFNRYWPIFFMENPQMPPIQLQTLYAVIHFILLLVDSTSLKFLRLEKIAGRVAISVAANLLGASIVLLIGTVCYDASSTVLAILFVLRNVLLDCARTLEPVFVAYVSNSMPTSPTWKYGIDMAKVIVWSVCAAIGGVIIEARSMAFQLNLTGVLEFVGVASMIMVIFIKYCGGQ